MNQNEEQPQPEIPDDEETEPEHRHRWSLLKDREFYEQSDLIARYYNLASSAADCPHVDSPIVDTVETLCFTYMSALPFPLDRPIRHFMLGLMQAVGNCSFVAGMRFALDGNHLDSEKFMDGEIKGQPEEFAWNEKREESVREWRETVRRMHYTVKPPETIPSDLKAALEKFMGQKLPDGIRFVDGGDGTIGLGIPAQRANSSDESAPGTGNYL